MVIHRLCLLYESQIDLRLSTGLTARMKIFSLTIVLTTGILCGCAIPKKEPETKTGDKNSARLNQPPIKTSETNQTTSPSAILSKNHQTASSIDLSFAGKILTFNSAGRFVVLDFPAGKMPALDETMSVYRDGKKIGSVKITGPTRDNNTVADLTSGEAAKGDEVRAR